MNRIRVLIAWLDLVAIVAPPAALAAQALPKGMFFSERFEDADFARRGWCDGTQYRIAGDAFAVRAGDQKPPAGPGLAANYPGDGGIEKDPAVIYADGFESADLRRWDDQDGNPPPKVRLVQDRTVVHRGRQAVQLEAPPGEGAGADLVKMIAPGRELMCGRCLARFQRLAASPAVPDFPARPDRRCRVRGDPGQRRRRRP